MRVSMEDLLSDFVQTKLVKNRHMFVKFGGCGFLGAKMRIFWWEFIILVILVPPRRFYPNKSRY